MNKINKASALGTVVVAAVMSQNAVAQSVNTSITNNGISTGSNTYRSFNDSPLTRDRDVQSAFDLLQDFYPAVEMSVTSHDNVRRRSNAQEEDTVITISPSVEYRTNLGRHDLYLSGAAKATMHDEFDSEDQSATNLRGNFRIDASKKIDVDLHGTLLSTYEDRGASGTNAFNEITDGPEEIDINTFGADVRYGKNISRLNAVVGFETQAVEYERTDSQIRDRDSEQVHLDVAYDVTGSTSAFVRIANRDVDYINTDLDSTESTTLVGVKFKPTGKIDGVFAIGNTDKDFESEAREDYNGSKHYANLNYAIKPHSVVSLNASSTVEEPGEDNSDYYVTDLVGLAWEHELSDKLSFNVFTKSFEDDYNNGRFDEFDDVGFGFQYALRNWLTAGLNVGSIERVSNRENVGYEDDYVGLVLKSNFRRGDSRSR